MKKVFVYFLLLIIISACSDYQKLLKSGDMDLKYQAAVSYYEDEDYSRSLPLFEELVSLYRGSGKAEEINYLYAYNHYKLYDYILAGYYFKKFTKTFPQSEYAEECLFMSALCYYKQVPTATLDQTPTHRALEEFRLFMNSYPNSTKNDTCNVLVNSLVKKLELKSYLILKQYFKIEDYRATMVSVENFIKDFPDSDKIEEVTFLSLKSQYLLAKNSIQKKKLERIEDTIDAYYNFVDVFPNSSMLKEAENIFENSIKMREDAKKIN
jgi:outer membrane protein assembly factor BamD